ncbi:TonB family protein [Planctomycetales bacterium ZRK34]|nr:TonB family protein [Planctomycetales bacterium ZRK34]
MNTANLNIDPRPATSRSLRRAGASIGIAVIIHIIIVWGLLALNTRPVPDRMPELPVRTILLAADRAPTPAQPKPEPEQPDPPREPLTINLDAPPPPALEPIDVALDLPSLTPAMIKIAVSPTPTPATPSKPQPRRPVPPAPAPSPAGPMQADHVDQPPREMPGNPEPTYPMRQQRMGIEASVTVRILIDTGGRVEDIQAVDGPQAFADAVMSAVRRWRFTPAQDRGRPVKVWGIKTFRFELRD